MDARTAVHPLCYALLIAVTGRGTLQHLTVPTALRLPSMYRLPVVVCATEVNMVVQLVGNQRNPDDRSGRETPDYRTLRMRVV